MNEDDKKELKKLLGDYVFYAANYYEYKDEEIVEFIERLVDEAVERQIKWETK